MVPDSTDAKKSLDGNGCNEGGVYPESGAISFLRVRQLALSLSGLSGLQTAAVKLFSCVTSTFINAQLSCLKDIEGLQKVKGGILYW